MIELIGLNNCDTCRTARRWLESEDIAFRFRDLREEPPQAKEVKRWLAAVGAENLVNRRSTTWRQLDETTRARAEGAGAAQLLLAHPTLMKRPVIVAGERVTVGFNDAIKKACRQ